MFDLKINDKVVSKAVKRYKEKGIILPTFQQQKNPSENVPKKIQARLPKIDMQETDPLNLFRITWHNDPKSGGFGGLNVVEIPPELSGVRAKILLLVGEHFPINAHKVGAAYGCLVPKIVTGQFDPTTQKAVWPSTGNYCRGGTFDCCLMSCTAVAILPEGMSKERFEWLKKHGAEVIGTPGTESNVKEIYDKCWEIRKTRKDCVIFNQFEEFGNAVWHYEVTGSALEELFRTHAGPKSRLAAFCSSTGSAGTINAGEYLKTKYPSMKIAASEALECPTLLMNGWGEHRIEGIGDKHVPWIHNVRNTDLIVDVADESCMRLMRLFNEPAGHEALRKNGIPAAVIQQLPLLGISSICNILTAVKVAKWYEMTSDDIIVTVATDSALMYKSRLKELDKQLGAYNETQAMIDWERRMRGTGIDFMKELSYWDRKAVHNLKYFTWVEQQGRTSKDLAALWDPATWTEIFSYGPKFDALITAFNKKTGLQ